MLFLASLCCFSACTSDAVYQAQKTIPAEGWHYKNDIVFEEFIPDSLSLYDIFVDIRNTTDYAYSNFFLFLEIDLPDGRSLHDTLELILADRRGQWTGRGFGYIRTNRFLYRQDVRFPAEGSYSFTLRQGMRDDLLTGISDVGISIQKK